MSHEVNTNIKEHLQYTIDNCKELSELIIKEAQKKLDADDLEGCIDVLQKGNNLQGQYINNEIDDYEDKNNS